jgi:DNA polymerase III epsilon subunit-like protein
MVKILAFDTETNTMLIREKNSKKLLSFADYKNNNSLWSTYINICPSIIQLSYILYDTNNSSNAKIFNKYIDIPDNIIITKETIKIHHITRETILLNKIKIDDALNEFMNDFSKADVVVGHNVENNDYCRTNKNIKRT